MMGKNHGRAYYYCFTSLSVKYVRYIIYYKTSKCSSYRIRMYFNCQNSVIYPQKLKITKRTSHYKVSSFNTKRQFGCQA